MIKLTKKIKRVGRGVGAGGGKTAGRGTKGQKSRTGRKISLKFEGGQTPLVGKLPKKGGFTPKVKYLNKIINLSEIDNTFKAGEKVNLETLKAKGLIRIPKSSHHQLRVKILGEGKLSKKLQFDRETLKFSKKALNEVLRDAIS